MAAHKVRGAREAVWMLRNAEKVSSICNDVVGDICGIISGATGALIVANITAGMSGPMTVVISLVVTGMVSALTIGGTAAGKGVAMAVRSPGRGRSAARCWGWAAACSPCGPSVLTQINKTPLEQEEAGDL